MATITGTSGNDSLIGTIGDDTLEGLAGDDTLRGNAGNDLLDGGAGVDLLDGGSGDDRYVATTGDVLVDSGGIDTIFTDSSRALASGFENITYTGTANTSSVGNSLNNVMTGNDGRNRLDGRDGNDTLHGGGGYDTLIGGNGNDFLNFGTGGGSATGGAGQDTFFLSGFAAPEGNAIIDFQPGTDKILLDAAFFTEIGAGGNFAPNDPRFYAAPGASAGHDADDRIILDSSNSNHWLYYDPDGSGPMAARLIAHMPGPGIISAADIAVTGDAPPPPPPPGVIRGTEGNDTLTGTSGNDSMQGLGGNDRLEGLGGNDSLDGGAGTDTLVGGLGDDTYITDGADLISDEGGTDTVVATVQFGYTLESGLENLTVIEDAPPFEITVHGNELANVIRTQGTGLFVISGFGGDDTIIGGLGTDWISGFGGDLVVDGGGGDRSDLLEVGFFGAVVADFRSGTVTGGDSVTFTNIEWIEAGGFNDRITADDAGRRLSGGDGNDTLIGGAGGDHLVGDVRATDHETPDSGDDFLFGGDGNDELEGGGIWGDISSGGNDTLDGGTGNDTMRGDLGADQFIFSVAPGTANADEIEDFVSGTDSIVIDGGAYAAIGPSGDFTSDDARFFAGAGANSGQDASDRIVYNTSTGQLWYDADGNGAGAAQLIATVFMNTGFPDAGPAVLAASDITVVNGASGGGANIVGTSGADSLVGGAGDDTLSGLGGNDTLGGSGGNDVYDGGANFDLLSFVGATSGVTVSFAATGTISGAYSGTFTNMEGVRGGDFADTLLGGGAAQNFSGRGGNDTIAGGGGIDTLYGGAGADDFVFREMGTTNADRVQDFVSGIDDIALDDGAFTAIGAPGDFAAGDGRFNAGAFTSGQDASDRVIYNTSTGNLYYDADGSGAGAAQLVATLTGAPVLAATDITVI